MAHFREVLTWVGPRIQRQDASFRRCIPPVQRLAITLCYLATGDSSLALQYNLRVAYNTVSELVYETCEAIIAEMMADVLHCQTTTEEWKELHRSLLTTGISKNATGALDGKHITIHYPPGDGFKYFNYKGFHSIVLFSLVGSNCKFLSIDVGICDA